MNATRVKKAATEIANLKSRGVTAQRSLPVTAVNQSPFPASVNAIALTHEIEQDHVWAYHQGFKAFALGNLEMALHHLRRATDAAPELIEAQRWLGRVALELGLGGESQRAFEAVIRFQGYTPALGLCLEFAREVSRYGLEAARQFRAGCDAYTCGRHEAARTAFEVAVVANRDHQQAWAWLGQTLLELRDHDGAFLACQRAVALSPQDAGSAQRLRLALRRSGLSHPESSNLHEECAETGAPSAITTGGQ